MARKIALIVFLFVACCSKLVTPSFASTNLNITSNTGGNTTTPDNTHIQTGDVTTSVSIRNNSKDTNIDIQTQTHNPSQGYTYEQSNQLQTQNQASASAIGTLSEPLRFELTHRNGYTYIKTTNSLGQTTERELQGDEGLTVNTGTTTIRITSSDDQFIINDNDQAEALTQLPLSYDPATQQIQLSTPDQPLALTFTPLQATNRLREQLLLDQPTKPVLTATNNHLTYTFTGTKTKKLLGLIPISLPFQVTITDQQTTSTPTTLISHLLNLLSAS